MRTTFFGSKIIKAAEDVLGIGYRSFKKNYFGEKLEEVIQEYDRHDGTRFFAGKGKMQPDYCAMTASVILDRAFRLYDGSKNTLRSASANTLSNLIKARKVRVDKKPAVGCLFSYIRNAKGQSHVGFVWKVHPNYIETIEGNTESCSSFIIKKGCPTKLDCGEYGILTRQRKSPYTTSAGNPFSFIHIDELFDTELNDYPDSENYLADENFCDIINESDFDFEGSDGDAPDPLETPAESGFLSKHKDKIIPIGSGIFILLLGIFSRIKK
jgi:hypothetical protein